MNLQRRSILSLSLAASATLLCANLAHAQARELNFGVISTESSSGLKDAWQPLLADLQKATGIKVNAFFAPDYAGVIEAMRFNKVQFGWFGNKSAMEAVDRAKGEIFARVVATDGTEGYYSLLIVNKDSPLRNVDDVVKNHQTLTLGYGDPNSTSGTLVPGYYVFGKNKIDPLKDFKRTVRSNHESNLLAVVNKQVDVASNNTENWARFGLTHPEQLQQVREIWRSPLIPSDPLVWRSDLDAATKKQLRDFFLAYGREPREKEILGKLGYSGFHGSDNQQLVPIRQLELAKQRGTIEADDRYSAQEKSAKLKEIDDQLAALSQQTAAK
ncbi:MAG TPA: phosphonate ABC transporter substrate-binding protein [Burkholderiaceae bacterium]|jgi:phosphonate transport system substrate-binding protein